jgi:predicted nucleic acid-binding protein
VKTFNKLERLIICDAGPLIALGKIDQLHLLRQCAETVWIPHQVWHEVVTRGQDRPPAAWLKHNLADAIRSGDHELMAAFSLQVDAGEAEALALAARNRESCLLIDDAKGRTVAQLNQLRCVSTLGLLVRARRAGLIIQLQPLLSRLQAAGWFIHPHLIQDALRAVGEIATPPA